MKATTRDILTVLRKFSIATENHVPRDITRVSRSNPSPTNLLATFYFNGQHYGLLFDDIAEDNVEYIMNQVRVSVPNTEGQPLENPLPEMTTYGMPFEGKDCYLVRLGKQTRRLDSELAERYPEYSRSTWQKHIKAGHVSVDGVVATSTKQHVADESTISIDVPEADFSGSSLPVIFEDDDVIVVNKPEGVLTHSKGEITEEFTVAEFFRSHTTAGSDTNRPGIIHRLDRDTSGVIIGARSEESAAWLTQRFARRQVNKTYIAVVDGVPKLTKAVIDVPIGRNPSAPSTFRADTNGKSAETYYEVITTDGVRSLVELHPRTGRTHQLRVHMAHIGTPICGDRVYGKEDDRLFLHAYKLGISLPSGDDHEFIASLPKSFTKYFNEDLHDRYQVQ